MSAEAIEDLETSLNTVYQNGNGAYDDFPVVVMEQTSGMLDEDCATYWGGDNCDDGYRKGIFSQNFNFPSGACLMPGDDGEVHYYQDCPF